MKLSMWRRAAMPVLALMLSACAGYTKRVDLNELPTGQEAYLFGRFHIEVPKQALALDGHQSMGFAIECEDKQRYVLRFDRDRPLLAIKVLPSVCSWTEIVYTNPDGSVRSRKPAPNAEFKGLRIEAGKAYYLGDFDAEGKVSTVGTTIRTEWQIKRIYDFFHRSSRDLGQSYPNLKALPTVNKALLQGPPAKDDVSPDIVVSEAEIRADYDKLISNFGGTEYRTRHILVSTEAQVAEIKTRFAQKQRFEVIAKAMSEDPGSRDQGGDLGWGLPSYYTPPFAQALRQLKAGERTPDAVKSEFGWHFIEVQETRELVMPDFEDIHDGIALKLRKAKAKLAAAPAAAASAASGASEPAAAAAPPAAAVPAESGKAKKTKKTKSAKAV